MMDWLRRMIGDRSRQRVERAQEQYVASLRKAVRVMPGDGKLRELLHEAERSMKGH